MFYLFCNLNVFLKVERGEQPPGIAWFWKIKSEYMEDCHHLLHRKITIICSISKNVSILRLKWEPYFQRKEIWIPQQVYMVQFSQVFLIFQNNYTKEDRYFNIHVLDESWLTLIKQNVHCSCKSGAKRKPGDKWSLAHICLRVGKSQ